MNKVPSTSTARSRAPKVATKLGEIYCSDNSCVFILISILKAKSIKQTNKPILYHCYSLRQCLQLCQSTCGFRSTKSNVVILGLLRGSWCCANPNKVEDAAMKSRCNLTWLDITQILDCSMLKSWGKWPCLFHVRAPKCNVYRVQ